MSVVFHLGYRDVVLFNDGAPALGGQSRQTPRDYGKYRSDWEPVGHGTLMREASLDLYWVTYLPPGGR